MLVLAITKLLRELLMSVVFRVLLLAETAELLF